MDWPKLMQMNWPSVAWLRTAQDVTDAATEIGAKFQRLPNNDEVAGAVRWLADGGHKGDKPPSLRELIGAIRFRRKESWEARKADGMAQAGPCWLCVGRGWAAVRPLVRWPLYSCDVPCVCRQGDDILTRERNKPGSEYHGQTLGAMSNLERWRRMAAEQGRDAGLGQDVATRAQEARDEESDAMLAEDGLI